MAMKTSNLTYICVRFNTTVQEECRLLGCYAVALVRSDVSEKRSTSIISIVLLRSERRLPVTANVNSSPILVTLMMVALRSSEISILTRATRSNFPEGGILQYIDKL
jgi:hypothetical protein